VGKEGIIPLPQSLPE